MVPLLVPPWNRIDAGLIPLLAPIGFTALSVFGPATPTALPAINSNVDLMDWHGTGGCREHAALVHDVVAQLARAFEGGDAVGILTHHLVHDAAAWLFLRASVRRVTAQTEACAWLPIRTLIGRGAA